MGSFISVIPICLLGTFHIALCICIHNFIIIITVSVSRSYTLDCSTTECRDKFINCPPREDCFVGCASNQSCLRSIVNCPVTGNCHIDCNGNEACKDMVIDASLLSNNFNLICNGNGVGNTSNHCHGIKIYGNTLSTNSGSFEVECSGNYNSCSKSQINCPLIGNCNILCDGNSACDHMNVGGPRDSELNILCNASRSCFGSIFNGAKSSKFTLSGCKKYKSCLDVSIYCPPNTNGHKNCFIEGNDNLGRDKEIRPPTPKPTSLPTRSPSKSPTLQPTNTNLAGDNVGTGIKIYAVNGWHDVDIEYSGDYSTRREGEMICGADYNTTCNIIWSDWSCEGRCNGILNLKNESVNVSQIVTNTTSIIPNKIDIDPYYDSNGNETNILDAYDEKLNGDIFILAGLGLVVLVCLCVGCAEFRKAMNDTQNGSADMSALPANSMTPSREYTYSSKLSKQYSHSRSERSKKHHVYDQMHHI